MHGNRAVLSLWAGEHIENGELFKVRKACMRYAGRVDMMPMILSWLVLVPGLEMLCHGCHRA